ncbi:MAG: glycosyltransferase family 4 protein [Rickettsiales bacterium]
MKIAIFRTDASSQDPASYNSQEMGLARGFAQLGHTVDIFMASDTGEFREQSVEGSGGRIMIIALPYRLVPLLNEPIYTGFAQLLRKNRYDYVQVNEEGNLASWYIARACHRAGLRFGIYQGMYRVLTGRKWALYERLHHRFFRPFLRKHCVGAFCKTSEARKFLEARGYDKTMVVPVGLDFEKFQDRQDRNWRDHLVIPDSQQLILYVGSLEERRNPQFIAELARQAGKDRHFVLVGEGPSRSDLEQLKRAGQLDNLKLIGQLKQRELPSLYEQADVFVLPSSYEIYGMVVAESLYFGTPVVSTKTAGPIDIIRRDLHGRLIPVLDPAKWLTALSSYGVTFSKTEDNQERSSYARSQFDWVAIGKAYMELVEELL